MYPIAYFGRTGFIEDPEIVFRAIDISNKLIFYILSSHGNYDFVRHPLLKMQKKSAT